MLVIHGGTIITFDGTEHRRLIDGVVVVNDDRIEYVGKRWGGKVTSEIDARRQIVIPGQISTHAHIGAQETSRYMGDRRMRRFLRNGFLHFMPNRRDGTPSVYGTIEARASLRFGFAALMRGGVTSVVAYGHGGDDDSALMRDVAAEMGIRLYWAPIITAGQYWLEDDGRVTTERDEEAGLRELDVAAEFIVRHGGSDSGRFQGLIAVDEFYLSTPALRRRAKTVADQLDVPFTMHFLEQHREFFETMSATGLTPVQLLEAEGVLGPQTILAHCLYIASHSLVAYPVADDLGILGRHGTTVAHSPAAFAQSGMALEGFDRYRNAGINVAMATDAYPLDMFAEMAAATVMGKAAARNYEAAAAGDVFTASNLAGAKALGRTDIGRIAAGAKADLVVIDPNALGFGPAPDPITALVRHGSADRVSLVMVDGRVLVENGRLRVCDENEVIDAVMRPQQALQAAYQRYNTEGKTLFEQFAPALKEWADHAS
ncbi:amidohydrolase family protein [Rhizobium sp. RAF56]|uniref:amidohydrolase family protein n=1 Tax=Rhizobium sp. RAF56 TaxID=3233062 RepID=UPI003F9CE866